MCEYHKNDNQNINMVTGLEFKSVSSAWQLYLLGYLESQIEIFSARLSGQIIIINIFREEVVQQGTKC